MKSKKFHFNKTLEDDLYNIYFQLVIGDDPELELDKGFATICDLPNPGGWDTYKLSIKDWKNEPWYYGLLAHELHHLASRVMRRAGVNDEEAFAYYMGFWYEKVLEEIEKLREKEK